MHYPRGSEWGKWDLHVHTPASIAATSYGGNTEEIWEKFILDLEKLPKEFRVLGVNDYIFIDGYKRLIETKASGRLKNIDLLLPVIELRIDKFGGTNTKLNRVNFHVIFSDEIGPEIIQQQFLNSLQKEYQISAHYEDSVKWNGVLTRKNLEDLGRKLIQSVPPAERSKFGSELTEGFNNLNLSTEAITKALDNHKLKGKFLTGVGKTEWWDIAWNDKSIADKKTIIQNADFVFIASQDPKSFFKARRSLEASNVNRCLLDCSDAHHFSSSANKDRIGNCFNWINADPTFRGLFHALIEYDERVFVGDLPPLLERVQGNQTKYIRRLRVSKKSKTRLNGEVWFKNTDVEFNPGLVSIIGNKGMGKSALADVLGLLCNTRHDEHFSFLSISKFRKKPENRASQFEAELTWESGKPVVGNLAQSTDLTKVENCTYIPQDYFEVITNQIGSLEESTFDKEIKKVIYSHVPEAEKLGRETLTELLTHKTTNPRRRITSINIQLNNLNTKIVELEAKVSKSNQASLKSSLEEKKSEIKAHLKSKPKVIQKPKGKSASRETELAKAVTNRDRLKGQLEKARTDLLTLGERLSLAQSLLESLETYRSEHEEFIESIRDDFGTLGIDPEKVLGLEIELKPLSDEIDRLKTKKKNVEKELNLENTSGKQFKHQQLVLRIKGLSEALDFPMKKYQQYVEKKEKWEADHSSIIGNKSKQGTLKYFQAQQDEIKTIPAKLETFYKHRIEESIKLFEELIRIKNIYSDLYKPVQDFIKKHPEIGKKIDIDFDVSVMNMGFDEGFFQLINRAKRGSFSGAAGAETLNTSLLTHDFNQETGMVAFINEMLEKLIGSSRPDERHGKIRSQLRTGKTITNILDYLFSLSYLQPRYTLKLGSKELSQLSPGERGALLLVFYLLVDRNDTPLIIDQPEHNLDNQTVYDLLVPAIKKAKKARQIIIVTHNPNLAVVCDSDQIIWASLEIEKGYKISYQLGSIENPEINKKVVDILEGTWGAFSNRGKKYSGAMIA